LLGKEATGPKPQADFMLCIAVARCLTFEAIFFKNVFGLQATKKTNTFTHAVRMGVVKKQRLLEVEEVTN